MQPHEQDARLRYYWQELTYLRRMGGLFAQKYPKVAARLELEDGVCPDPHVERLIESFAFLTARIQQDIDSDFPEIAGQLLQVLHPHYLHPVPPMTVVRFDVDPERGKFTTGHEVPKHTRLFTRGAQGQVCHLRTCYPVILWPLELTGVEALPPSEFPFLDNITDVATVLRIRVETRGDPIHELELDRLRFYINGDRLLVSSLYELVFSAVARVALLPDSKGAPTLLPAESICPVGFGLDEEVLPYPRYSQPAFRLLQEYFVFPEKFFFFDVEGLGRVSAEESLDILLLLRRAPGSQLPITDSTLALGCAPAINLFPKTTEPIRVDQKQYEYRLVPDYRREEVTEIHTIERVSGTKDFAASTKEYQPFYSFSHDVEQKGQGHYWHAKRVPTFTPGVTGTDIQISFIDLDFKPTDPPTDVVYARTLCHNRALAEEIPAGGILRTEAVLPAARIVALHRPTPVLQPPLSGQAVWRLVSHLSLNHLSLTDGDESLKALREILKLYCFSDDAAAHQQIMGIREMSHRRVVRRLGEDAWRGFSRGDEITLRFDEEAYVGTNAFLLGAVLNHFFALYGSTNSFTQVVLTRSEREGEWKRWHPMAGERVLL